VERLEQVGVIDLEIPMPLSATTGRGHIPRDPALIRTLVSAIDKPLARDPHPSMTAQMMSHACQ
jgi:hypothetical protein